MNDIDHFRFWKRMKEGFHEVLSKLTNSTRGFHFAAYRLELSFLVTILSIVLIIVVYLLEFPFSNYIIPALILVAGYGAFEFLSVKISEMELIERFGVFGTIGRILLAVVLGLLAVVIVVAGIFLILANLHLNLPIG